MNNQDIRKKMIKVIPRSTNDEITGAKQELNCPGPSAVAEFENI